MQAETFFDTLQQKNEKNIRDYFHIVLKRKAIVLTVMVIIFLSFVLSTFSETPLYTASTRVLIEKNATGAELQAIRLYMMWDPEFMATQFELIRSFNVAHRVVEQLHLDSKYKKYFLKKSKSSYSPISLINQFFSSVTHFLFSPKSPSPPTGDKQYKPEGIATDADRIAVIIQSNIHVQPIEETRIVTLSYNHEDPFIARMVANAIVKAYIDETLDIKTSLTRYTLQWMSTKAEEERNKLEKSEKNLQQYMRDNDIVTLENKLALLPQKLSELNRKLTMAQAKGKEYEAIYQQIEDAGNDYQIIETLPLFADNRVLQNLRNRIYSSEQTLKELSRKYGYKHPLIIQAKAERKLLNKEKQTEIKRIIESTKNAYELAQTQIEDLTELIASSKQKLLDMNERFIQYTIMKRELDMNQSVYDALATSIKKENITEQAQDIKIWVIKKANLPGAPSSPNINKQLSKGLLMGTFVGILLAFLLEYLDNTVTSAQKVEELYGLTVLGSVEDVTEKKHSIKTYILNNPLSPLSESYRMIRSSLLFSTPDHPPKTMLITSMVQQEGKTVTTGNLARILAQNDKKVLIIDCDMRRPNQHSFFGIANTYGLSNQLSGNTDNNQTLIQQTAEEEIYLISAGPIPPNPAELLHSKQMRLLLKKTQQEFDFILLDSPPVQQVTDSLALTQLVDGTIVVIRAGKTTFDILGNGLKKLNDGHAKILGVVLNRLAKSKADKGYYDYYSYYSKKGAYTKQYGN